MSRPPTFYLIAGEPSGDRLGAALMRGLAAEAPGSRFVGIGGRQMAGAGLEMRHDMAGLGVMGLAEVVPRLPALIARVRATAADVRALAPDALVTIDSPGFTLAVARRVRARATGIRTIHYVAPSVWAWRPGRARRMARFIDHVLALLPFEPPLMRDAGMSCDFVGHPAVEGRAPSEDERVAFRARAGLAADAQLLLIAPGSRAMEVQRLMPVFAATLARLQARLPGLRVVIPLAEGVEAEVSAAAGRLSPAPVLLPSWETEEVRRAAFAAADAALVKSGSIALELAAAGTPMVAAYRANPLTAALARRLIRVDTASLVNLVAGVRVVPEFIQERCTPEAIAPAVFALLTEEAGRAAQRAAFMRVTEALGRDGPPPSFRAARSVLRALGRDAPGR